MASENSPNQKPSSASPTPAMASCRKKKSESATFLEDVKDHIDEFIHASMDEHKTCFQKTIKKMFSMSKVVAERSSETREVESSLPLRTTVAENGLNPYYKRDERQMPMPKGDHVCACCYGRAPH